MGFSRADGEEIRLGLLNYRACRGRARIDDTGFLS
jgi:hypothetical protein